MAIGMNRLQIELHSFEVEEKWYICRWGCFVWKLCHFLSTSNRQARCFVDSCSAHNMSHFNSVQFLYFWSSFWGLGVLKPLLHNDQITKLQSMSVKDLQVCACHWTCLLCRIVESSSWLSGLSCSSALACCYHHRSDYCHHWQTLNCWCQGNVPMIVDPEVWANWHQRTCYWRYGRLLF